MKKSRIVMLVVLGLSLQLDAVRDSRVHAKNDSDDIQQSKQVEQPKVVGKKGGSKKDETVQKKQTDSVPQRVAKKAAVKPKEKKRVDEQLDENADKKREGRLGKKDAGNDLKEKRAVKQAKKDEQKKEVKQPEPLKTEKRVSFLDGKVQKIKDQKKELENKLADTTEPEVRPGRHGNSPVKALQDKIDKTADDLQAARAKHRHALKDHEEAKRETVPYLKAKDTVLSKKRENVEKKKKDLRQSKDSLVSQKKADRKDLRQDKDTHEALLLKLREAKTNNDKPAIKQLKAQLGHSDHDGIVQVDKQIKDSKEQTAALRKQQNENDKKLKNAGESPSTVRHDKYVEKKVLSGDATSRLFNNTHKELNAKADELGLESVPAARLN